MSNPSLQSETVVGPNGAVTTRAALLANEQWGIGDAKRIERVTDGVYLKEALQIEGGMQFKGQPLTIDAIRKFFGTLTAQALAAASVDDNLQFVRYLVAPRKAEARRQTFTLAVVGDSRIRRLELRNGVLVISDADAASPTHFALTRQELAAFVLGTRAPSATDALSELDRVLDRSHLMPPGAVESVMKGMHEAGGWE